MNEQIFDPQAKSQHRLTTVVAVDICEYSKRAEKDETSAIALADQIHGLFSKLSHEHRGRIFHKAGDGFLAEFSSTNGALDCAIGLLSQVNKLRPHEGPKPEVRIGIHVGDVVLKEDGDLMGHCVNVAARIEQKARPGTILISSHAYNLVGKNYPRLRPRHKDVRLKNISAPFEVYELRPPQSMLKSFTLRPMKYLAASIASICLLSALFFSWNEQRVGRQIDRVVSQSFDKYSGIDISRELDREYITGVLRDLRKSGLSTEHVAFTLLKEGRLHDAILVLEKQLKGLKPSSSAYITTLLEIGALSYQYDPRKAAAAYEAILLENPDHLSATIRLGRSYDVLNEPKTAAKYYQRALTLNPQDYHTQIWIELDIAFNLMMTGQADEAIALLDSLSNIPHAKLNRGLISKIGTERGIALELLGRIDEAEGQLIEVMPEQRKYGYIYDLSRAHNILGQIAQKRSIEEPNNKEAYLRSAIEHYKEQLSLDIKLNKKRGAAEANYYIGQVQYELENLESARQYFLDGLRLSRQYRIPNIELLNLLGLAQLEKKYANQSAACAYVQDIQVLYDTRIQSQIGPITRERIAKTKCPFSY